MTSNLILFTLLSLVSCASYQTTDVKYGTQEDIRVMGPELGRR